ncbi:hypothetical protein AB0M41_27620, partial [Streptomyces sp. NPDC051896]
ALGRWWAEALGRVVVNDAADEYEIRPAPDRLPGLLLFGPAPETVENRHGRPLTKLPAWLRSGTSWSSTRPTPWRSGAGGPRRWAGSW